jgi:hypothetical protein
MLPSGIKERNGKRPEYQQKTDIGSWRQNARKVVLKIQGILLPFWHLSFTLLGSVK